jgi:BirA family transcriptional regulator, biotin operon repressor / biotin---[acetyl-CoA-carboxylase] ligase
MSSTSGEGWSGGGRIPVVEFEAIDSTNLEAMRRATQGECGPLWLRADRQIAGKGRSGRGWSSPAGNLSATLLFVPDCPLDCLAQLSLVFGIALVEAVTAACASAGQPTLDGLHLKWPNDVLIGPAKLAGILIETSVISGRTIVAVGCGVNIAIAPAVADRRVTCLADHGIALAPSAFLEMLSAAAQDWLQNWSGGRGFGAIRAAWLVRANPVGTPISVNTGRGSEAGLFAGLDTDGALLMSDGAGNLRRFHFGDVTGAPSRQSTNGQTKK